MKKILAVLMAILMALSFSACSESENDNLSGAVTPDDGWTVPENKNMTDDLKEIFNNAKGDFSGVSLKAKELSGIRYDGEHKIYKFLATKRIMSADAAAVNVYFIVEVDASGKIISSDIEEIEENDDNGEPYEPPITEAKILI